MSYVGADWASGLWLVVAVDGDDVTVSTEPSMLNVWQRYGAAADALLVDVPIGLPETAGGRACDRAASAFLGDRSSSVFSVPCREAVEAERYDEAREACGGSLSSQSWWLFPRIREVDAFLQCVDGAVETVYEGHPEVCFEAFADESLPPKDTERGLVERLAVLASVNAAVHDEVRGVVDDRADGAAWHDRISGGRRDDVVDAAVLAATAAHLELGRRGTTDYPALPEDPDGDPVLDVPMEIVFPGGEANEAVD